MYYQLRRSQKAIGQSSQSEIDNKLVEACKRSSINRIRELVGQGASPDAMTKSGINIGHWAAKSGKKDVLETLLNAGADIHRKLPVEHDENQMIHEAAQGGHDEICELLVKRGADVNSRNSNGITPLYTCTRNGYMSAPNSALLKTAEKLLEMGADIDARCDSNTTINQSDSNFTSKIYFSGGICALNMAAYNEFIPMFALLLRHGADVDNAGDGMKNLRKIIDKSSKQYKGELEALLASNEAKDAVNSVMRAGLRIAPVNAVQ